MSIVPSEATPPESIADQSIYQLENRLFFLDFLKAVSIVAVVSFHSTLLPVSTYATSAFMLDILFAPFRFCVPTLLLVSFFLLERSMHGSQRSKRAMIKRRLSRLAAPTIFWFSIATSMDLAKGNPLGETLYRVLIGEAFTGAYYLLVVFQLIPLAIGFRKQLPHQARMIAFVVCLQMALFLIVYSLPLTNQDGLLLVIRSLGRVPFIYWFAYTAIGAWIYQKTEAFSELSTYLSSVVKGLLLVGLAGLFMVEYTGLITVFHHDVPPFEYVMMSCLASGPILFLCSINIRQSDLPRWFQLAILTLSKYSLGIFCINGILSRGFLSIGANQLSNYTFTFSEILMIKLVSWMGLLLLSWAGSVALSRIGLKSVVC